MFTSNISSSLAQFYVVWANELETRGNTKKADAIYNQGIQNGAQPLDLLRRRHQYGYFTLLLKVYLCNQKKMYVLLCTGHCQLQLLGEKVITSYWQLGPVSCVQIQVTSTCPPRPPPLQNQQQLIEHCEITSVVKASGGLPVIPNSDSSEFSIRISSCNQRKIYGVSIGVRNIVSMETRSAKAEKVMTSHICHTSYYIKSPLYPNSTDMFSGNFL